MAATLLRVAVIVAVFAVLAFSAPADAFSLGTLQRPGLQSVHAGETAVFRILFWNSEGGEYSVEIRNSGLPEGWTIIASPNRFLLNSTPSGNTERIYLPGPKSSVSAKVVEVYAVVPDTAPPGRYEISLQATAGNSGGAGFSLLQERQFLFAVNVSEGMFNNPDGAEASRFQRTVLVSTVPDPDIADEKMQPNNFPPAPPEQSNRSGKTAQKLSALAAIIAIITAAWMVYRHD